MPFEHAYDGRPRHIAVIGGGISGLGAALDLAGAHRVTLFEAEPRLGGHACTVLGGRTGQQPVDMGFIVFNRVNYPRLTALFERLDVAVQPADMGFGVSARGGHLEYALRDFSTLFAQRRNVLRPAFLNMLRDILRFNAGAEAAVAAHPDLTVGELVSHLRLGQWFRDHYLLPFSGAIWSSPSRQILEFPARAMVQFFRNHALLQTDGQPPWLTVAGGSGRYVARLERVLAGLGVQIRTGTPIAGLERPQGGGVRLRPQGGDWERFDAVVLATHSDVSLKLLSDADGAERAVLGAVRYQPNRVVLHADPAVMPRRRRAWAAWVHTGGGAEDATPVGVSYWMNRLQSIPETDPLFVTLNPRTGLRPDLIQAERVMRHPVFDAAALAAQARLPDLQGRRDTWFCGAWTGHGFHEDGLASGQRAAADLIAATRRVAA